jgi:outer membrane protein TolC
MRTFLLGALPCLLMAQAPPLSYDDVLKRVRTSPEQYRADSLLAERQLQLQESRGFLRDGPTVALLTGPRRTPGTPTTTDRSFDLDLPLFLSSKTRSELERSLGEAHPLINEAVQREGTLRLRTAYLNAWLAGRLLTLRQNDLATVERWLKAAQARFEAGADPAYQVSLVEGELLKLQQDLDEAWAQEARTWGTLVALADVPTAPLPLADPGPVPVIPTVDLERRLQEGPLRKALFSLADMEERSLRLKEAQALNRWSLRGSYAQEGDDKVTRFGLAVRLPRPGEGASLRAHTEAQIRASQGTARQALAELDARALAAISRIKVSPANQPIPDFGKAIEAISLRLQEGRERPSDALPIRRQLLESQMAALRRHHNQHLLAAELQALLPKVNL